MRWIAMLALGMSVFLGRTAWAQGGAPTVLKEAHAAWAGCDYTVWVSQGIKYDPYPKSVYRIFAQIKNPAGTCAEAPASIMLADSEILPTISITAEEAGVVVGYSSGAYYRSLGGITASYVVRLDPSTLGVMKQLRLNGGYSPPGCVAGGPGSLEVAQVSILNHSDVVLLGGMSGNSVCAYTDLGPGLYFLGCTPCDGTGATRTGYSSTFPEFFTGGQPVITVTH